MSEVINPPEYYFTGINFNPAFYAQDAVGLSEATANALYLRKTVADTATAQETFSSGIVTNAITASAVSSTMAIGNNITSGAITIGSAMNAGTTINLGNNNTNVVQVNGRLQTNFVRTKNIIDTLEIADDQTSGALNLGYRTDGLRTGAVNIGSATSTTNLNGTSKTNTIDALGGATATMNLASSITSGTINLMTNTLVSGIFNLMYNAVSNATGTINIGQYNTSPSITKTTANIRGDVNIGTVGATTTATTINVPLTIGYVPSAITLNTQLGFLNSPTITWNQALFGVVATTASLNIGVYIISVAISLSGTFTENFLFFTGTAGGIADNRIPVVSAFDRVIYNGSYIISVTSAGVINLVNFRPNSLTFQDGTFKIVRIG